MIGWTPPYEYDIWYFLCKTREETIDVVHDKFAHLLLQKEDEEDLENGS
jgi:hypothetical protein